MKLHHLAAVAALAVSSAQAAQESTTMNVFMEVTSSCDLSASSIPFGTMSEDQLLNSVNNSGTVDVIVSCPEGVDWVLSANTGMHSDLETWGGTRAMKNANGDTVGYDLLLVRNDGSRVGWGDGTASDAWGEVYGPINGVGNVSLNILAVEWAGTVLNNSIPEGLYGDTVTITLDY